MTKRPNLIGFGSIAVDDLVYISHFPRQGTKMQVDNLLRHGGGLAGTALVAAARLGANPSYFGVLGDDALSNFTIKAFQSENVKTDLCIKKIGAKPFHSIILVVRPNGERTILYTREGYTLPSKEDLAPEKFEGCEMIFIDSTAHPIFEHVCRIAHTLGIPILADIEHTTNLPHQSVLDTIQYWLCNIEIARQFTGKTTPVDILRSLETTHRKASAITAGENGCWFKENNKPAHFLPAYPVDAMDTTGCGDVFHGAFAAAILRDSTIPDAIMQAAAAAAMKATQPGGRKGIPNLDHLLAFITNHKQIIPKKIS